MHTQQTHKTREKESADETTRHAATSLLARRHFRLAGRMYLTPCSKRPGVAIASTTCRATQAQYPNSSLLSGHPREHRRAVRNGFALAAGSTDFLGHRRLPRVFRRESIWDLSACPYQRLLPARRIVHQDPLGHRQSRGISRVADRRDRSRRCHQDLPRHGKRDVGSWTANWEQHAYVYFLLAGPQCCLSNYFDLTHFW